MIDLTPYVKVKVKEEKKEKKMTIWEKIKAWFVGDGGLLHPLCGTCNGCDCHKFPKCDHILLNEHEFWSDSEWLDKNEPKYQKEVDKSEKV